ncbi:hypothetical protein [Cellulosilyticum ruminicola]|uniref:hypothetical protein n=1 Tax=Cellulosilyticum ruminicola TaxID=425254 RepID=UPI0012EEC2AA|nr:hypothetical protein [Cellulosilyticum ruminicola]
MHIAKLVSRLFKLFIPSFIEKVAKSALKCYKSISERYTIYEQLELEELLSQNKDSID